MKAIISRTYGKLETLGVFMVVDEQSTVYHCVCIELPDLGNQHNVSCIKEGVYICKKEKHAKFGWCFRIYNVPDREGVLIHIGNYAAGKKVDTEGCILPGLYFTDLNSDGNIDVAESTKAMTKLLAILPNEFPLHILS
jgi:hypothetical protein